MVMAGGLEPFRVLYSTEPDKIQFAHYFKSGSGAAYCFLLDIEMIPTTMTAAIVSEEVIRPSARPPSAWGLVNVSPRVAPRGRVKTYAAQKRTLGGTSLNKKCAAATRTIRPANTSAPR